MLCRLCNGIAKNQHHWQKSLNAAAVGHLYPFHFAWQQQQTRGRKDDANISALFKPVPVKSNPDDISVGAELTGKLNKAELLKVLNKFTQKREVKLLCFENGLDGKYQILFKYNKIHLLRNPSHIFSLPTATSIL